MLSKVSKVDNNNIYKQQSIHNYMVNKSKKFLTIGVVVILLFVIAAFAVVNTQYGGGTVLSISSAKFLTNAPDASGEDAFLINVVANQGGEKLVGEITPDMISQYGITEVPEGPFTISLNLKDVQCNYQVTAEQEVIYKIYQATVRKSLATTRCGSTNADPGKNACPYNYVTLENVKDACRGDWGQATRIWWGGKTHCPEYCGKVFAPTGSDFVSPGSSVVGGDCDSIVDIASATRPDIGQQDGEWCYLMPREIQAGFDGDHWEVTHIGGAPFMEGYKIGNIASPSFVVEIELENAYGDKKVTTLTEKQTSAFIEDIGKAKFVGSLVAQEFCGQPAIDYNIIKDLQTGEFKEVKKSNYDNYQTTLRELQNFDNNYYTVQSQDPGIGKDVLNDKMSTLNAELRLMSAQQLNTNCELNGMIYSCEPEKDLIYPEIQLIIKSDWIGVIIPDGEPEIVSVNIPTNLIDGEASNLAVKIKNVGDNLDSFDTALICDKKISLGSLRTSLNKDESKEIFINFLGQEGLYNCEVVMTSVNNPTNIDTESLKLDIAPRTTPLPQICQNIPDQPCDRALWSGYPICEWNEALCTDESAQEVSTLVWYIISGLVVMLLAIGLFVFYNKSGVKRR